MNHDNKPSKLRSTRVMALFAIASFSTAIVLLGCSSSVEVDVDRANQPEQTLGAATFEPLPLPDDPWLKGCCPRGDGWECPCLAIVVRPGNGKK